MRTSDLVVRAAETAARWRHARLLHPRGVPFTGEVVIWGPPGNPTGVPALDEPGRYPATVRLSRGTPTPPGWPDVLGLAVRLHGLPTGPFDLLVSSSAARPLLRHLPLPRRSFTGTYTTIVSYRAGGRRLLLGALPDPESGGLDVGSTAVAGPADAARPPGAVLAVAYPHGSWRPFGQVVVGAPLDCGTDAALAFDPVRNLPPGLRATGLVQRARALTYRGSQRARRTGPGTVQSGGSTGATV
ncbi:phosphodiesterase [Micromonospora echinofusca]|uniref:Phosphodiesterase n=1 Tax=Micromonospora echinofusca TaxID=47858 RepID=A0ABS3W1G2_MICEH|nr:phosphodiesterase [Micromonospora echinofusca]MBO4210593.1 phosphodiesterase [Micromonospora echinofusca]